MMDSIQAIDPTESSSKPSPTPEKRVVAFLYCQWFLPSSIDKIRRKYETYATTPERRAKLNELYLFYSSLTGRRLRTTFGDLCWQIVWEETTKELGDHSSFAPKPDLAHVRAVLDHFKPAAVLTFGKVAAEIVKPVATMPVICSPHPAARHATVVAELKAAAAQLKQHLSR